MHLNRPEVSIPDVMGNRAEFNHAGKGFVPVYVVSIPDVMGNRAE